MNTHLIEGRTLPEVYHNALLALDNSEEKEISVIMKIREPLAEPMISKCWEAGWHELEQYRQEMLEGILDFEVERGNWHYTYHQRMKRWKQSVIDELQRDPASRRAVISIRDNALDAGASDPACMQSVQYMIRGGKLHCWILFRSNDAVKASFMNMFALIMLQKEFADALGVPIGTYTHMANSYHCYPEDVETLANYVARIEEDAYIVSKYDHEKRRIDSYEDHSKLAYEYKGFWDKLMEDEKPSIAEMVEEQHKKYLKEQKNCANCGRKCAVKATLDAMKLSCYDFTPKEE